MLLERFKNTDGAVLFATASFWQGVDVPGDQLSCVIVDKLPVAVPSDPIVAARVKALQEDGRNAFAEYQVPQAVLALKQRGNNYRLKCLDRDNCWSTIRARRLFHCERSQFFGPEIDQGPCHGILS